MNEIAVVARMTEWQRLKPLVLDSVEEEAKLRHELRSLVRAMESVPLVPIPLADLAAYNWDEATATTLRRLPSVLWSGAWKCPLRRWAITRSPRCCGTRSRSIRLFERFVRNFW